MDMEKSIAFAVRNLSNQFHRHMLAMKAKLLADVEGIDDITETQGLIITYLYDRLGRDTIYQKDIEKEFRIRRSTATILLKRMEKAGLIYRQVNDDDGRMKAVHLTERAMDLHPKARAEFLKAEKLAKKGLTSEEIATFLRVAEKIGENIA